jgi:hypothetical protein
MPHVTSSSTDRSPERCSSEPRASDSALVPLRSPLPLGFGGTTKADATLPAHSLDAAATRDVVQATMHTSGASPLVERDLELLDFLVTKAIEKCTPTSSERSPALPGARQRSAKRKS